MLKMADQHFLHDLVQFWQRGTFFVLLQGALFSVFASTGSEGESGAELAPALLLFGIGLSGYWGWISRITAMRIEVWREVLLKVEPKVGATPIFEIAEEHRDNWRRNSTTAAQWLPWAVLLMWIVVGLIRYL
jgi:hypothetical protein